MANRKVRRRLMWAAVLVVFGLVVSWALRPKPMLVDTATVARGRFHTSVREDGVTRTRERYVIAAPVSGELSRIEIDPGARIESGMVLATIGPAKPVLLDARSQREARERVGAAEQRVAQAQSMVSQAATNLTLARREYERTRRLFQAGAVAATEFENAQAALRIRQQERNTAVAQADAAGHELAAARAVLGTSSENGGASTVDVRAPAAGTLLRVLRESEGAVAAGTPLLEVATPGMEVVADVLSDAAVEIEPGDPVRLEGWGGAGELEGRVRAVEPGGFTKVSPLGVEEQRVNVRIDITSPREKWMDLGDGYRVETAITTYATPSAVTLPTGAVFRSGERWAVFVITEGRAHLRHVELGPQNDTAAILTSGLRVGDTVVLYPGDFVKDGMRVRERT